ncbi:MAG: hypothetical protein ACRDO8_02190, partial [Nocardioidaceae bacterium]
ESTGDSYSAATRTLVELNSRAGRVCSVCAVPSLTDLPASLRSQVQELTGSDPGAAAGGDGRNGTSKDPVATGRADGPGSGSKNDSGPTTKSPAGVPSIGPDLPDVEVPGSQEPGSSSPSVVPTPRTPNLDDPVRKATKPIEKLLDPVLSGLLGSGQQGSAGSNPDRSGTGDNSTDQGGKTGGTDSGRSGGDGSGSGSGGDGGGLIPGLLGGLTDN